MDEKGVAMAIHGEERRCTVEEASTMGGVLVSVLLISFLA
jgi:hypothetical protein